MSPAAYRLSPRARALLERALSSSSRSVILRTGREEGPDFAAAHDLAAQGLLELRSHVSSLSGEARTVWALTERGEAVARVSCAP